MELFRKIQGSGSPLLLIHGIISDHTFFAGAAKILSEHYTVITYDRTGYGRSPAPACRDGYSVKAQADELAEMLKAITDEPVYIFGNSAGGLIAIEMAFLYPELIRAMILMEPSLGYDSQSSYGLRQWNCKLNSFVDEGKIKKALLEFTRITGSSSSSGSIQSIKEMAQIYSNLNNFMYGELNMVQNYLPDTERCQLLTMPVYIGVTEKGKNSIFATSSLAASKTLGWPVLWFPGYHNMASDMPMEFSERLVRYLSDIERNFG